jgi:hypothetical protein
MVWAQMGMDSTADQDYALGIKALRYFHDAALQTGNYNLSFEELVASFGLKPDGSYVESRIRPSIEGIGLQFNVQNINSESTIQSIMESFVNDGEGRLPTANMVMNVVVKFTTNPSVIDTLNYTIYGEYLETGYGSPFFSVIRQGGVKVGDKVTGAAIRTLDILAMIKKYAPYALVSVGLVAALVIYNQARKALQ